MIVENIQMDESQYKKVPIKKFKQKPLGDDAENRYWKSFKEVFSKECQAGLKQVCSNSNQLNQLAYTDGQTVEIFSTKKNAIKRTLARFKSSPQSIAFRNDGQLLAIGQENGMIDIYNLKIKLPLRVFKNFKKSVQTIAFSPQNQQYLFAASDEGIVKQFDVANESVMRSIPNAHGDFIRCIKPIGNDEYHLLTSGYDHKINVFDFRNKENIPVLQFDAEEPVESICVLSDRNNFVSVQGMVTTLWDYRLQKRIQDLRVNQKTLTDVKLVTGPDGQSRIMTCSLDHQIKYIRPDIFRVTHQAKHSNPLMCIDQTENGFYQIIGDSAGRISVLCRGKNDEDQQEEEKENDFIPQYLKENPHLRKRIQNFKYFNRGIYQAPENVNLTLNAHQTQKLGPYDKLIVQFKYKEALLKAITDKQSQMVVSICEELINRGGFEIALKNLNKQEIDNILDFIEKKIVNPKFFESCSYILNHIIDQYPNSLLEENHQNIISIVKQERIVQSQILQLQGMLELMLQN